MGEEKQKAVKAPSIRRTPVGVRSAACPQKGVGTRHMQPSQAAVSGYQSHVLDMPHSALEAGGHTLPESRHTGRARTLQMQPSQAAVSETHDTQWHDSQHKSAHTSRINEAQHTQLASITSSQYTHVTAHALTASILYRLSSKLGVVGNMHTRSIIVRKPTACRTPASTTNGMAGTMVCQESGWKTPACCESLKLSAAPTPTCAVVWQCRSTNRLTPEAVAHAASQQQHLGA